MECLELWSVRLHIICRASRKMNHLCSIHYFHKMQNAMLILSQDTQKRIAQESLLRQTFLFRLFFLSLSRLLLSRSLALFHLCLYLNLSVAQTLSLLRHSKTGHPKKQIFKNAFSGCFYIGAKLPNKEKSSSAVCLVLVRKGAFLQK